MTHEQREEYIRQAKRSFHANMQNKKSYPANNDEIEERVGGYWKVRLVIAVLIFVVIFSFHQTNIETALVTHEKLTAFIEKDIDVQTVQAWFEQ